MATHTTLSSLFTAIADAIRAKKGTTAAIVADNFPTEIANLSLSGLSGYTKLGETTFTVNTTSTSAGSVGTLNLGSTAVNAGIILYVRIRDTAGKRAGYFYGSDCYLFNCQKANATTTTSNYFARTIIRYTTSSTWATYPCATNSGYGIYAYSLTNAGVLNIYRRYNSSYSLTINGTYKVEAYFLDTPDGVSPFA